jgi:5-methyltetrahydropteroyltriglutamate--homocysteine methyltransferase
MATRPPPGTHEPVGSAMADAGGLFMMMRKPASAAAASPTDPRDAQDTAITAWLNQYAQALPDKRAADTLVVTDGGLRKVLGDVDFFGAIGGLTLKVGKAASTTPTLHLTGKLRRTRPIVVNDAVFLQKAAGAIFAKPIVKQTMPAPTMLHRYLQRDAAFTKIYPKLDAFFCDLTAVYVGELEDLMEAGVTYVQLNDNNLPMLCAGYRGGLGEGQVLGFANLINQLAACKPAAMTMALHLRRDVAVPLPDLTAVLALLVAKLDIAVVMVDFERPCREDLAWLSALPNQAMAVLGLINGEREAMESEGDLRAALTLAAQALVHHDELKQGKPMERLSLGIHGEGVPLRRWVEKLVFGERVASEVWRHP